MFTKKWYTSKTIWVNVIATAAIIVQVKTGKDIITPELQIALLGVVNLALRTVTSDSVEW